MEPIIIRYGESLTLPLDAGDLTATSADIYIGKPGNVFVLTKHITLTNGEGVFTFTSDETKIPLGEYRYQINVNDDAGNVEKYPSPEDDCEEDDFPKFVVREALDLVEVS